MRMWMVEPKTLCRKHLLGEHVESHMCLAIMRRPPSMLGYVKNNLVEPQSLRERHDALAAEMGARGYNHKSPMPDDLELVVLTLPDEVRFATVGVKSAMLDLHSRCPDCAQRYDELCTE